jgi:hypothetical protein
VIVDFILTVITAIVGWVDALLPHLTMPSWLSAGSLIPSSVSNFVGAGLHIIAPFFPSAVLAEVFVGITSLWPFIAAYVVAQWIVCHVPTIAGFSVGGMCG